MARISRLNEKQNIKMQQRDMELYMGTTRIIMVKNLKMNIYELPPLPLLEEVTTILSENKNIRIERIISTGQVSDWYDQTETEFVILLDGNAVIEYENGDTVKMSKGDTLLIKPHERHRVSLTSSEPPCVWLCVFY